MYKPRFGKVRTIEVVEGQPTVIRTDTYYDGEITGSRVEIEESVEVDEKSLVTELFATAGLYRKIHSKKIDVTIEAGDDFKPKRILRKWTEKYDKNGR